MTDNIIDRDKLQDNLINQILDDMDIKTMMAILYDQMDESYDKYSVQELIAEIEEYYPQLLDWVLIKGHATLPLGINKRRTFTLVFIMSNEEMYKEMYDQEEDNCNAFDDIFYSEIEVDYTTQL